MFHSISWPQYIAAVFLVSAAWYLYVGIRYYRPAILRRLGTKTGTPGSSPPVASKLSAVMGVAKPDEDTAVYEAEELIFSGTAPDDISDQTIPPGPGDDLLAEAKLLVDAYQDQDDQNEFLTLLQLLIDRYEADQEEISLPAVMSSLRAYAAERLPFHPEEAEWPFTFQTPSL